VPDYAVTVVLLVLACQTPAPEPEECAPNASELTVAFLAEVADMTSAWAFCEQDTDCILVAHPDPYISPPLSINEAMVEAWEEEGAALYEAYWVEINGDACMIVGNPDNAAFKWAHCEQYRCKVTIDADNRNPEEDSGLKE
jgi:hypothetical protein